MGVHPETLKEQVRIRSPAHITASLI